MSARTSLFVPLEKGNMKTMSMRHVSSTKRGNIFLRPGRCVCRGAASHSPAVMRAADAVACQDVFGFWTVRKNLN